MRFGLTVPLVLLALAAVGLALTVLVSGRRKRLMDRVDTARPVRQSITPVVTRGGSELRLRSEETPRWRWLTRLLNMPVDMPHAHVISPWWVLMITTGLAIATAWGSHLIVSWLPSIADAAFMWVVLTRGVFGWELDRYRAKLLLQLPDTIHLVISATRAGLPVSEAFRTVAAEMPGPTNAEFARVCDEIAVGGSADQALLNLHRRTGVTEYAILAVTIGVQARSGGRLAETIHNLAETVRDRIGIAGKARALSAEARTSAIIMSVLPFLTGLMLMATRPGYLNPLFTDPRGQNMLIIGVTSLVLGIVTMRQLVRGATRD